MKNTKLSQLEWSVHVNKRDVGFPNYYWQSYSDTIKMESLVVFKSESSALASWKKFSKLENIKPVISSSKKDVSIKRIPMNTPPLKIDDQTTQKEDKLQDTPEKSSIFGLSSRKIIDKVFELTGEKITIGLKSKQRIIKRATEILLEKGIKI